MLARARMTQFYGDSYIATLRTFIFGVPQFEPRPLEGGVYFSEMIKESQSFDQSNRLSQVFADKTGKEYTILVSSIEGTGVLKAWTETANLVDGRRVFTTIAASVLDQKNDEPSAEAEYTKYWNPTGQLNDFVQSKYVLFC